MEKEGIYIKETICPMCGKKLDGRGNDVIKAHLLPKTLNPYKNIFAYIHKKCEERINALYVSQEKKTIKKKEKEKLLNSLWTFKSKMDNFEKKLKETDFNKFEN